MAGWIAAGGLFVTVVTFAIVTAREHGWKRKREYRDELTRFAESQEAGTVRWKTATDAAWLLSMELAETARRRATRVADRSRRFPLGSLVGLLASLGLFLVGSIWGIPWDRYAGADLVSELVLVIVVNLCIVVSMGVLWATRLQTWRSSAHFRALATEVATSREFRLLPHEAESLQSEDRPPSN